MDTKIERKIPNQSVVADGMTIIYNNKISTILSMLKSFLQKYRISQDEVLIIACSGGPDSMYLLSEIAKIHPKERIVVAHFNHAIRGAESDGDEVFLRDFCTSHDLVFQSVKKDIPSIALDVKK